MLHLEDETNPLTITGILTTERTVDFERLKAAVQASLLSVTRYRQRVVWPRIGLRKPYWEDDPDLDLDYHLQQAILPPPGDQRALRETISLLASTPLDLTRSPWQMHLVDTLQDRSVLVFRMHHCVGDGAAVIHLLLTLTDLEPDAERPALEPTKLQADRRRWRGALERTRHELRSAHRRAKIQGLATLAQPGQFLDLGRAGLDGALDLGRFLLLEPDPPTVLSGPLGQAKRVAWSAGIPLENIETIRTNLGGTVNDVVVTVIAGGLRRYLQAHGEPVDEITLRAAVPVSLRPAEEEGQLGNRMGAVFLTLPVWNAEPACRLREVELRMKGRKASSEAPLFYVLLNALGLTPAQLAKRLVSIYGTRATAVISNVKGPQQQLYLAGAPVDGFMGWVPQTGSIGVGISILSYAGQLRVGVFTDAGLVPDPEAIVAAIQDEFRDLLACALEVQGPCTD
jgi:WS/DGAT/MGAT family acyltransferase